MTDKKYKIITISDHPLAPSGVATQKKYLIDHFVKSDRFEKIFSLAGALKHSDYKPSKFEPWGDKVIIIPIDGYVNKDIIRNLLDIEKPDAIFFTTDPRFYLDLWQMEDEIHSAGCALVYNHLWDNADELTWPRYNKKYYDSTDFIGCINKLTFKMLNQNGYADKIKYIPHGVPEEDFFIMDKTDVVKAKVAHLGIQHKDSFVLFYNSRNALRKRTGNVILAFKHFLDKLPADKKDKAILCMKTSPVDPEGQELNVVVNDLDLKGKVAFADKVYPPDVMREFYNMADATISLSSEEGFGLSILESLMCGTPVICSKTGGMQDQVIDDETGEVFGYCLEPDATSLVGSQMTPYIYSHHIDPMSAANAIMAVYDVASKGDHKNQMAGEKARASMMRRFNLKKVQKMWEDTIIEQIEKFKSKKSSVRSVKI